MAITGGKGYGFVFETAGQEPTLKMAFEVAANKANVCCIGTPHKEITFTPALWEKMNRKEFHTDRFMDVLQRTFSREENGNLPHIILQQDS